MLLTVTVIPVLFAIVAPNAEEYEMWESLVRYFSGKQLRIWLKFSDKPSQTETTTHGSKDFTLQFNSPCENSWGFFLAFEWYKMSEKQVFVT